MNRKNNLFEDLNIKKANEKFCAPLDIDIQAVKRNVNAKLDFAYKERKSVTMKSKKKIALIAIAATFVWVYRFSPQAELYQIGSARRRPHPTTIHFRRHSRLQRT